ncbi:DUF3277 family protein [Candidatus Pacearchaeota archaeon]|nr:DUF3277 family protein [Candidatus Pacearchaeota archaeon]
MPEFKNYTFSNINVIFGILELQGYADGDDVVDIDPDTEQFTKLVGAKGDVARSQTNDNSCTVTVKLLQTSLSNKELTRLFNIDRETGAGAAPMIINDKETGETYTINNAWIQKIPKVTRGQGVNQMEWVFQGDFLTAEFASV